MTIRKLTAIGIAFGLGVSGASADEVCGIGRVAVDLEGTVRITQQLGECALLEKKLVVSRLFPTSQFLFNLGFNGTCFEGQIIDGAVTIAGKPPIAVEGASYSAQYAGEAFKTFETETQNGVLRIVYDVTGKPWVIGDANTYVELTRSGQSAPFLSVGFDDTFLVKADGTDSDTEKFTAVSPGVTGTLVAEGPILSDGAELKGRLCVATTLLR